MASDSASGFLRRNRPPRVQIAYADPYDAEKNIELPFVMGVMSDLSGNSSEVEKDAIADRNFTLVDTENFDDFMHAVAPGVSMNVANKLGEEDEKLSVKLDFHKMEDLDPGEIAKQVPALAKLLEARDQLANLQRYMNGKSAAQDQLAQLLADPKMMALMNEQKDGDGGEDA
ncbi:type VI secretion system contractile sheath small subunit [Actibacterium sp. 188UL27-1]|uniref:type VI secretion system contractile sheath small subunit n=1 Tax=Actibacterium sp. 188UL27-1 TaxID=2786961 RepID=UPI0019586213|nr:type VI secretion system contractile sheath small subunit [Actibacterium sp. 188UL27-1]MBM7068829.1 type VI secretion system contractile sheath small subunit [Actibacterium sp. 188UL27-1]